MTRRRTICVIGLGAMGLPIARRLLAAGFVVRGVDRDEGARQRFSEAGGHVELDAGQAVSGADAVLMLVVNAAQAADILFGTTLVARSLAPGAVVIMSITAAPSETAALAAELAARDLSMVDCPLSGGVARAAAGTLSVIASGPPEALDKAEPFLAAMGKLYRIGESHGQASTVKLLNQLLCGVHLAAAAETIALAERLGVDPRRAYEVITASSGTSWMFADRAPSMLEDEGRRTAHVDILLKDLRLVADLGGSVQARLPLARAARAIFEETASNGLGSQNDSSIIASYRET